VSGSVTQSGAAVGIRPAGSGASAQAAPGAPRRGGAVPRPGLLPNRLPGAAETALAIGVVAIVALLVTPVPPFLIDVLLAASFAAALVVLLVTVTTRDPLEFSVFPSLLLLLTLFRLGLNVSSTRLILGTGHAGQVIAAFGDFVIGGNVVVGLVIFLILVLINFMVITKGAGRIAEVAARFTLDAMPGRQMSIDADLSAGLIDENEARRRREEISRYADFFGSMDGAAKFVRGDAIAGILITAVNLVGGFVIGMTQHGMSAGDALRTYSTLTVGDGLVTQIPALIVSTAAGLLVTAGSSGRSMGPSMANQLSLRARPMWGAAGVMGVLALVPGLPSLPFLAIAAALGGVAAAIGRRKEPETAAASPVEHAPDDSAPPALREVLSVEPLEVEVGFGLVPLVDESQGGDVLRRIGILRKQLALDLGVLVPPARVRDNLRLQAGEYTIKLRGSRVAGGQLLPRHLFAIDLSDGGAGHLDGVPASDPSFGLPGVWIDPSNRAEAEAAGYAVVEPSTVLATHLTETLRERAGDLLTRQAVREMLDGLKETHPALVDDVVPNRLSLGAVQRVLQRLLREGVPVRDFAAILEALSDAADATKDPEALAEHVRRSLGHVIAQGVGAEQGAVRAITVGPRLELALMQLFGGRARDGAPSMDPSDLAHTLQDLMSAANRLRREGRWPALVTPPALRVGIRRLVEPVLPRLPVVSLAELPSQTPVDSLVTWEVSRAA